MTAYPGEPKPYGFFIPDPYQEGRHTLLISPNGLTELCGGDTKLMPLTAIWDRASRAHGIDVTGWSAQHGHSLAALNQPDGYDRWACQCGRICLTGKMPERAS